MRFFAILLVLLAAVAAPVQAQETRREGIELTDEVGVAARGIDGDARFLGSSPVLELAISLRLIVAGGHGVGIGGDFAFDMSGDDEAMHFYGIDLFYLHPWMFEEGWEVTPIFGLSCGWADATLTTCTTDCNAEQMMRQEELDQLDAFLIGGRVGFSVDRVFEFIHVGLTASVRVMTATGEDAPMRTYWQQSLLLRVGFRFDL